MYTANKIFKQCQVMPLNFIPYDLKNSVIAGIEVLVKVGKPWIKGVTVGLQKDSDFSHKIRVTQECLADNFSRSRYYYIMTMNKFLLIFYEK